MNDQVRRWAARGAAAALTSSAWLVVAVEPASALFRDDGDSPGQGLSWLETVGWFVLLPLGIMALVALMIYGPSSARKPRYRPGVGWWAAPVWFSGPDGTAQAGASALTTSASPTARGGASARW